MLFEITLLLTGTAILFFIAGIMLIAIKKTPVMPLAISGLLLLLTGLLIASNGLQIQTGTPCINKTTETSHVWNCSTLEEGCIGTPEEKSCYYYNITQCTAIPGCEWVGNYCYGTPEWTCRELYTYGGKNKCEETKGCYLQNESNPQTCDRYITSYEYTTCPNQYTNITETPLNNTEHTMQTTYFTLILGGLFLLLWAATTSVRKQEQE